MKYKLYSLLLLLFVTCASYSLTVNADTSSDVPPEVETTFCDETTTNEEMSTNQSRAIVEPKTTTVEEATTTQETTTKSVVPAQTYNKTVKVNKTFKIHKILKLNTTTIKNYTFTANNKKVSISSDGTVKGLKKGSSIITVKSIIDNTVYATINVKVKNRYTKSQLRLMSAIIYSEAGAETYAGKKAVGIVIMNRVRSKQFPNSIKKVIYQRGQFGPASNGSLNRSLTLYDNGRLNSSCIKAAKEALNGDATVNYKQQTHNMNDFLFFSGYVKGCRLKIQNHQFK